MKINTKFSLLIVLPWFAAVFAADSTNGTAIVVVDNNEYIIPVECDDAVHPELGLFTEPNRITRERTGRSSGVRLTIRPWKDTDQFIVNLDRYVAWIPRPESGNGVLKLTLAMSAASTLKEGIPTALTYDDWVAGVRPEGLNEVSIEADCNERDPEAPAYRRL